MTLAAAKMENKSEFKKFTDVINYDTEMGILEMPRPTDKQGVLRVMGMINVIGKFIPNLSSKTVCIRELLQHTIEFKWTSKHEKEWIDLKASLTTEPVLTFFDSAKTLKISTDASKDGLGAVLVTS